MIPIVLAVCITGCAGNRLDSSRGPDGRLADCPDSPNCVSSKATDEKHAIQPFTYEGDKAKAYEALLTILASQKRTVIVEQTDDYLHLECKSMLFRFVDDVEFYFPKDEYVIHVRSASRTGYSDLGVNRKRMEQLRKQFTEVVK